MHTHNYPITKTIHHAVYVTSFEAKLFTIRCGINQALNQDGISKIIIITDSIHVAKKIFDLSSHPLQIYSVAILTKLCQFFLQHYNNFIKFWECPSHLNWSPQKMVNKETKAFNVKIVDGGLYFIFLFIFIFLFFSFLFHFSIFRTARVRVDWSRCHISHKLMAKSQD